FQQVKILIYCKHQGHKVHTCSAKRKDDEYRKRKAVEAANKNKTKTTQGNDTHVPKTAIKNSSGSTKNARRPMVYKPVPHQNQTSKEPQKGIDSMLPSPQLYGSVAVPTPSVAPKVYQDNQCKDANNKQGIDSMLPTPQPHGSVMSPFLVFPLNYFITSKPRMPTISKVLIQCSINPTPLIIVLFYLDLSSEKSGGVKGFTSSNMDDPRIDLRAPATTTYQAPMIQG
ncbi:hypothetical protein H5410_045664, partial [Solanum commersonii]